MIALEIRHVNQFKLIGIRLGFYQYSWNIMLLSVELEPRRHKFGILRRHYKKRVYLTEIGAHIPHNIAALLDLNF
jgi:hypothetical protein